MENQRASSLEVRRRQSRRRRELGAQRLLVWLRSYYLTPSIGSSEETVSANGRGLKGCLPACLPCVVLWDLRNDHRLPLCSPALDTGTLEDLKDVLPGGLSKGRPHA